MLKKLVPVLVVMLILVSACDAMTDPTDPTDPTATTTQAPDTTQAPETTEPGTEEGESTTPWWLLILIGIAFLVLIIAFVSRGSKKKVVVAPPPVSWKDSARSGYADARWLYDAMSEDLGIWRGNATFDSTSEVGATAATALADTWRQLDARIGSASDHLYALEAASPDQRTAEAANATVRSMRAVRTAVDSRAEARMNYRSVQETSSSDPLALQDAREREVRSARLLAESRSDFGSALTHLSTVL